MTGAQMDTKHGVDYSQLTEKDLARAIDANNNEQNIRREALNACMAEGIALRLEKERRQDQ